MESQEVTGRTVEEAIDRAAQQLGVAREDLEVVVVDRGRAGILGLGAEQARVRVSVRQPDAIDLAKETIESLLRAMGVSAVVGLPGRSSTVPTPKAEKPENVESEAPEPLAFNIDGEDAGLLIGRRGETLAALQFMVNFILNRKAQSRVMVALDVEGYRERRYEALRSLALRMAERAVATGRSIALEPMPARERRIVHMALASHSGVTTESVGEGESRKVTIVPKRAGPPRSTAQPRSTPSARPGLPPRPMGRPGVPRFPRPPGPWQMPPPP